MVGLMENDRMKLNGIKACLVKILNQQAIKCYQVIHCLDILKYDRMIWYWMKSIIFNFILSSTLKKNFPPNLAKLDKM